MKYWFLIFCLSLQSLALAEETTSQKNLKTLSGVWKVNVNKQNFLVCLDVNGTGFAYNKKNPNQLIELSSAEKSDSLSWTWRDTSLDEIAHKPFFRMSKIDANKITVNIQYGVKTTAPAVLRRIKTSNTTGECLFDDYELKAGDVSMYKAFNAPRVKTLKVWQSAAHTFMGKQYHTNNASTQGKSQSNGEVSSLVLSSDEQDMSAINLTLDLDFESDKLFLVTCGNITNSGGDYNSRQKLRYWNNDWVSISTHSDGYCGGAHPFFSASVQTFNISTGKIEDIWQWFKLTTLDKKAEITENTKQVCRFKLQQNAHKQDEYLTECLPSKLVKKIYQARTICDQKCQFPGEDVVDFRQDADGNIYSASLSPEGVLFLPHLVEPARGMRTYFAHYVIPYAELKPFLSKKGREEVDKIEQLIKQEKLVH